MSLVIGGIMILDKNRLNYLYISNGTNKLYHELMKPPFAYIIHNSSKPCGGVWTTEDTGNINSNFWLRFIADEDYYGKYSNDAVLIKLKETAKILYIKDIASFLLAQMKYPVNQGRFLAKNMMLDYHKIAKDYDGVLLSEDLFYDRKTSSLFKDWAVESLVIFNLNCVEYTIPLKLSRHYSNDFYTKYEVIEEGKEEKIQDINPKYVERFQDYNECINDLFKKDPVNEKIDTYWNFNEELYMKFLNYRQNKKIIELTTDIVELLNNNVCAKPVDTDDLNQVLMMKWMEQNYNEINNTYKKCLKK